MLARNVAGAAVPFETVSGRRIEDQRYCGGVQGEAKPIPIEFDLRGDVDVVFAARRDEAVTVGSKQLRGPGEVKAREPVEQGQLGAWLGQHEIAGLMTF